MAEPGFVSPQEAEDERRKLQELAKKKKLDRERLKLLKQKQYEQWLASQREPIWAEPKPTRPPRIGRGLPKRPTGGFKWKEPEGLPQKKGTMEKGPSMPRPSLLPKTTIMKGPRHGGGPKSITSKPPFKGYPKTGLAPADSETMPLPKLLRDKKKQKKRWRDISRAKPFQPGKPGWWGDFPGHSITSIRNWLGRTTSMPMEKVVEKRIEKKLERGELLVHPQSRFIWDRKTHKPLTPAKVREAVVTEMQTIKKGEQMGYIIYRPSSGEIIRSDTGRSISYPYAERIVRFYSVPGRKRIPIDIALGIMNRRIRDRMKKIFGATPEEKEKWEKKKQETKILKPDKTWTKVEIDEWRWKDVKRRQELLRKELGLPVRVSIDNQDYKTLELNNRFHNQTISDTFRFPIKAEATMETADKMIRETSQIYYYNVHLKIKKIMEKMGDYYKSRGGMIAARVVFTLKGVSVGGVTDPRPVWGIGYIGFSQIDTGFRNEVENAMRLGFGKAKLYDNLTATCEYVEVYITSQSKVKRHW